MVAKGRDVVEARAGEDSAGREPEVDGARRERSGLQQPKADRTLEVREEWRAPAEDHQMDDEHVLVHEAAADEAGGERRPADLEVAAEVPPELLEDRLRIAAPSSFRTQSA